ncbi:wax ester/triacylglycerol synthase family O-acyltransferase [Halieaceae bacterium IMCC14734]|uniref:diacylglycerol O-acyltransferase n=1 Tax=Candidatus Litorirhabdus singularis TaxID=2518993 RepID=A0ABT3TIP2_9GAMM|nr:wax ester/triacylglycerol synthase family O-acyltransferase [Candidatus Litorirhabdus singularis]MCX2982177.1 wax ester/triacylglycerol synthase family O-acyltransferase [Candidatus Litorirhabdus singularis]
MLQLTGMDASFLYLETPNAPMHISGLVIYDQSTAPGGKVRFKEIIENYDQRLQSMPPMTRRLVEVPLNLDHPYWVSDGNYDPEFHIRHLALPKPGDWRQLCILISRLHARPLDRKRPLWEAYVIEGLDNVEGVPKGSFAVFSKTHHAAIDGTSGMEMTAAIHDMSPDYIENRKQAIIQVDSQPSRLELVARAQINNIKKPFHFVDVAMNTMPGLARTYAATRRGEFKSVKVVPRTRFNDKVSPHRVFDAVSFELEAVKAIKNSVPGATVNDAAIAIVGGAMRKYLEHYDELPDDSMVAMAPVNVRTEGDNTGGNVVSALTVQVRSDIAEPLERLQAVHEGTRNAKEMSQAIGAKAMTDYTQFIPSMLTAQAARMASRWGLLNRMKPLFNCVITNVPGPQVPLYSTGAKMIANYGTGPVFDGLGLFHVISSYCGAFTISATSCRDIMPDPSFYRQCLEESFAELAAAATKSSAKARSKATSKTKPKRKARAGSKAA